jgi:hypothetical protein
MQLDTLDDDDQRKKPIFSRSEVKVVATLGGETLKADKRLNRPKLPDYAT